jgi:decaprenylphospho-beta-D-erythro-pentofuranosid-2-ulose 2-reductase
LSEPAKSVLILGAHSDIARAIARTYAGAGRPLILAARNCGRLEPDAADLRLRFGVPVRLVEFDVIACDRHARFLDDLGELPPTVICVVGLLGNQVTAQRAFSEAELVIRTNYLGPASVLGEVANRMEALCEGCIIGISSVAGDRGRASNYVYGSAKAGLTAFLSGLRNRLATAKVRVITVKPGFVDTSMTAGMTLPKALTAQPEEVARRVFRAEQMGSDVVYVRPVWRLIMLCIRLTPERLFKRLRL